MKPFLLPLPKPAKDKVSSEETKEKLRKAMKGRKKSKEHISSSAKPCKRVIQKRCGVRSHYSLTLTELEAPEIFE